MKFNSIGSNVRAKKIWTEWKTSKGHDSDAACSLHQHFSFVSQAMSLVNWTKPSG